eukprot:TRINITY_DN8672_c0_g1_i6.p1 TRINITY_DN8672_c0_g1~~TRINITY_DN8672_c0_g1_i6.p1  ORF type:complete len:506 (-),score=52.48 TRINITY_DN8672_c0_g1_i6:315-1832(-)
MLPWSKRIRKRPMRLYTEDEVFVVVDGPDDVEMIVIDDPADSVPEQRSSKTTLEESPPKNELAGIKMPEPILILSDSETRDTRDSSSHMSSESQSRGWRKKQRRLSQYQTYIIGKRCEVCNIPARDDLLLLCDYCDDSYHTYCLDPPVEKVPSKEENWACPVCKMAKKRYEEEKLADEPFQLFKSKKDSKTGGAIVDERAEQEQSCAKCRLPIAEEMLKNMTVQIASSKRKILLRDICVRCTRSFHPLCFGLSKASSIICGECMKQIEASIPKSEKGIQKFFNPPVKRKHFVEEAPLRRLDSPMIKDAVMKGEKKRRRRRRRRSVFVRKTHVPIFRVHTPSTDPVRGAELQLSLCRALIAKGVIFDDDLCFPVPNCPPEKNDASLEIGLKPMDKATYMIFRNFKQMTRKGVYAPLEIVEDKLQGFVVRADAPIPKKTLIAEYVGEVDYARNHIFDDCDSIMDLLRTSHSSTSLVVISRNRGNISRFFSGINNHDKKAKSKQQNVR